MIKNIAPVSIAGILGLFLVGCASSSSVDHNALGSGYQEVTHTRSFLSEPQAHQTSLQYQKPDTRWFKGKSVMIWPSVHGVWVTNDLALFVGDVATRRTDPDDRSATERRLFAVRTLDYPLDITDEVLWRWSQQSAGDFSQALKTANIVYLEVEKGLVVFHFANGTHGDIDVSLDWSQIADVMDEVKATGVMHKDQFWSASFIEKEFQK